MSTNTGQKLERIFEKYDLDGLGDDLVDSWTGSDSERESVRELEHRVNFNILKTALQREGITQHWKTTEDQTKRLANNQNNRVDFDLQNRGVDIEEVSDDFVSYQTVHNYLCEVRGVEYKKEPRSIADQETTVVKLESRLETVVSHVADSLNEQEWGAKQTPEVDVDVALICDACGERTDVVRFIRCGGCPECTGGRGDCPGA